MCCVAVLIQPNNIWTRSSDGSTTALAEAQLTPGKKNNAWKWMQQLTDLTFMYQRMRRSIKPSPRAYLGLPCHSGATGFWQPVYCLLLCMSAWLCHRPWQAWWILWFPVVLELLYFQTNCFFFKKNNNFKPQTFWLGINAKSDHRETHRIPPPHLERWGRL